MLIEENVKKLLGFVKNADHPVKIVAATKTRSAEEINALAGYGITAMGENRVQELLSKYDGLKMDEIHFIGALQTNKVKYIVDKVCMIQSVDRAELAAEIEKRCAAINKIMDVLIEVNAGGEESKSGCDEDGLFPLLETVSAMPHIRIKGLMSVLPINADVMLYDKMKELYDKVRAACPTAEYLSVGMSGDYEIAVAHGANMIRPGSLLFGERIYTAKK